MTEVVFMDCTKCIYGYYYDTCNATWENNKQYNVMLETQKCLYFSYGHEQYQKVVEKGQCSNFK